MQTTNALSFEEAYGQLEEVVAKLESGEMTLEESVSLFERGKELAAHCQNLLDKAELRVKKLSDDGTLTSS
jgi:exodeoxyribonuclease VII small subunit